MTKITKQVNQGDSVSIQATPNTGYQFSKWTDKEGTTLSTSNPYTFTPSGDTDIKTVFTNIYEPLVYVSKSPNHTLTIKNNQGQTRNLNVFQGTNRYYGTYEGFTIPEITDIYVNNPTSSTTISETDWLESIDAHSCTSWINIGRRNFAYCTSLETVILPNSIAQIGSLGTGQSYSRSNGPFSGCSNLSNINIPTSCQIIHTESFYGCSLGSIVIPGSMLSIYSNAFNYAGLSSVVFQEGVSTLGSYAFMENPGITTINLPTSLTNIGTNPFLGCSGLGSIRMTANSKYKTETNNLIDITNSSIIVGCKNSTIPTSGVNKIGEEAFDRMILSGNLNLSIPGNITKIGRSAFYECTGLSSISFSSTGLTTLLGYAFYGCTGLSSITLPSTFRYFGESTTNTGGYCFAGCNNLQTVYLNTITTPPYIYRDPNSNSVSISLFPSTIRKIYVKSGTMADYMNDTNGWDYWYNQKKLYIGVSISSDVSPVNSGTVSKSSNSVEVQSDTTLPSVILTATPNAGYNFLRWTKNSITLSTSNPYTATIDGQTDTELFIAESELISYTISASVDPSGSGTISGTGTYNYGDSCTLVCTPATGYAFSEWTESGSTVSSTASYTFTVSGNRTLVAACQSTVPMHTITVLKGQNAELSPEYKNPTFSGGGTYPEGTTITISMTSPSTQYTVAQWYNQTETVQGNYDTWTKYSLNGHYVDSNSISYTVGDHDETIYCNVFSAGGNSIYSRHFETYDDPMTIAQIPAFDCYDSNNNLLGTWTGAMDQAVDCPFTASSVYKLVNHVEYIEPEWDPGNPMPVYSNLGYLDSADFSGLTNLHEIDGNGGSGGGMYIGATSIILPPSCTVVKNMHFGAAQLYDESTQQLMWYYPRQINFGNVETVEGVEFACYNPEDPSIIVQEMTIWDGEGNYGIRQWAVSTYKLSSMTDFSIGQCYQPELYFPNLPSGSSIGAQGLPALTGDTVYMTPNITKISLQDCSGITSITIPAHIEEIGNMRCSNLASITFEGGLNSHLKYINQYAFQNCTSLTSLNIPYMAAKLSNNYQTPNIGYNAFMGCTGLTTATIGARAVDNYIFQNCTSLTSVSLPYLSTIMNASGSLVGQGIFFGCSSLKTVRLGSYYSGYVQGVSKGWLGMPLGSTSTPFWKYNNSSAYPSTITAIYYDYEDGPNSSLFINSGIPNSKFVLHIGEDAMDDGTNWDNIGNLKTDPDRLQQDL